MTWTLLLRGMLESGSREAEDLPQSGSNDLSNNNHDNKYYYFFHYKAKEWYRSEM